MALALWLSDHTSLPVMRTLLLEQVWAAHGPDCVQVTARVVRHCVIQAVWKHGL